MRHSRHTFNNVEFPSERGISCCPLWLTIGLSLLFGLTLFASSAPAQEKQGDEKKPPASRPGMPVEAAKVKVMPVSQKIRVVGTLNSNESVVIAAEIAGRVAGITFGEGQRAEKGQVLARLDRSILEAQRDRAQASLTLSRTNRDRAELLFKKEAISQRERDEAMAQWKLDEASLRLAEAQLEKTVLRAPFEGLLGLRHVSAGEYVQPGQPIVTLDDTDPIKVDFGVPEVYSSRIYPGQTVQVAIDAAPGRTFTGEVYAVDPTVDPENRSLLARAKVPNRDGAMRPGMFAQIQLVLEERPEALMIPEEAVFTRGLEKLVYNVEDGVVVEKAVKTGMRQKGMVEITEGLSPGETVITAGQIKVRPGMPVTVLPAKEGN